MGSSTTPVDTLRSDLVALTALLTVPMVLASYGLAGALVSPREGTAPGITVALATLLSVSLGQILTGLARRAAPLRWPLVLATVFFVQGFLPFVGALRVLTEPLVSSFWRCGTQHALLFVGGVVLALGVVPVAFFLARWKALRFGLRGMRVLRTVSGSVLLAMGIVTVYGAWLVASRPQAHNYFASLPRVGEVPAATLGPAMPVRFDVAGPLIVWRSCDARGCDLSLRQPGSFEGESLPRYAIRVEPDALRIRVDRVLNLAVFESSPGRFVGAIHLRSHEPMDVTWAMLHGRVAPPYVWLACAGLGFLLALVVFVRSAADTRALRRWRSARAGLFAAGVVRLDDPPMCLTVTGSPRLPEGPVLLFEEIARAPFREASHIPFDALRAGTHAELETAIVVSECARLALAAVIVLWTVIPLTLTTAVVR